MKTLIAILLDMSGSMGIVANDVRGGINAFIEEQKALPDPAEVYTVCFDTEYVVVNNFLDLKEVKELTSKEYLPRGGTAYFQAICLAIDAVGKNLSEREEKDRPDKVLFVTYTDGEENASPPEFTLKLVKEKIKHQTDVYKWDFVFMGADMDTVTVSGTMGYTRGSTQSFLKSSAGVSSSLDNLSKSTVSYRKSVDVKSETFWDTDKDNTK